MTRELRTGSIGAIGSDGRVFSCRRVGKVELATLIGLHEISPMLDTEANRTGSIVVLRRCLTVGERGDILEESPRKVTLVEGEIEREARAVVKAAMHITALYGLRDDFVYIHERIFELRVLTDERELLSFQTLG